MQLQQPQMSSKQQGNLSQGMVQIEVELAENGHSCKQNT